MKLLLDQNLPRALLELLLPVFPESAHVSGLGLVRASDEMLWTQARVRGFHIATQDSDFLDIAELRGVPPKILFVSLGNLTTAQLLASIEPVLADLPVLLETSSLGVAIEGKQGVTRPL